VRILGNAELLRRAVENVLRNAIRYAPAGSAVDISLARNGANAVLIIRDQGPGVPDDALPRIFQPFYRVDDSRAGATGGVGLGLAIASRAVRVHHGTLTAGNAHPGLSVCLEVPLAS
jgi:two-component system sensor histidine kinase CpxA